MKGLPVTTQSTATFPPLLNGNSLLAGVRFTSPHSTMQFRDGGDKIHHVRLCAPKQPPVLLPLSKGAPFFALVSYMPQRPQKWIEWKVPSVCDHVLFLVSFAVISLNNEESSELMKKLHQRKVSLISLPAPRSWCISCFLCTHFFLVSSAVISFNIEESSELQPRNASPIYSQLQIQSAVLPTGLAC